MSQTAKLFFNGRSQAVRLPVNYRFDVSEVYIRRDDQTGDVILSRKPADWDDFFSAADEAGIDDSFLDAAERQVPPQDRDPFGGTTE